MSNDTTQRRCLYLANNYFLCPNSLSKTDDTWLNSGHPCKFSIGHLLHTQTFCSIATKTGKDKDKGMEALYDISNNTNTG